MNNDYYVIFDFDNERKLIFIEKHQKDDTILKTGTYQEMERTLNLQDVKLLISQLGNMKTMKINVFK